MPQIDDPGGGPQPESEPEQPGRNLDAAGCRVLAIDLAAGQIDLVLRSPPLACVIAGFRQVTSEFLAQVAPDIVLAPLFSPSFDVLDLAERLVAGGFRGRLFALTAPLPRPDAVRAEVREHATGLCFDLLLMPRRPTG